MSIYEKLGQIQKTLKAPKNQRNKFGGYNYRSCEDILEAVKPPSKTTCFIRFCNVFGVPAVPALATMTVCGFTTSGLPGW